MDKFIFVDVKKLWKRYMSRILVLSIPFVQFEAVVIFIVWLNSKTPQQPSYYSFVKEILVWGFVSFALFLIIAILISVHLIKAHKKNTFIEIFNRTLVISRHAQTVNNGLKREYYKKLYVTDLTKLKSISIVKGNIVLVAPVREFYEKSSWLYYVLSERGISFDTWWFNYNSSVLRDKIEITDVFLNTPRQIKLIRKISKIETERFLRRQKFHEEMLELAKNSVVRKSMLRKSSLRRNMNRYNR